MANKMHRTARGRLVDMESIRLKNELVPAVGNMKVNARGDQLGPGGRIVKSREQIMDELYNTTPITHANNPTHAPVHASKQSADIPTGTGIAPGFTPGKAEVDPPEAGGLAQAIEQQKGKTDGSET
jgi:hypothetical protein